MNDTTEIALILDQSGSMQSIKAGTLEGVNGFLLQQKEENDKYPVKLSLTLFNTNFEIRHSKGVLEVEIIPSDKKTDREYDGTFSLKEMTAINAILFLNRFNTKSAVPTKVEKYAGKANEFWKMVNSIPGITNPGIKTVATQSVILKALANLYYLFSEGKISAKSGLDMRRAKAEQKKNLEALVDGVTRGKISFSHENPIWRYYERDTNPQDPKFKNEQGRWISEYLPGEDKEIPVIGAYDPNSRTMKFATQHNSIFPILGDMIRWQLCLPIKTRRNTEKKKRRR